MNCPLGHHQKDAVNYLHKDGFFYLKCKKCGIIFLREAPEDVEQFYQTDYFHLDQDKMESGYVDYENDKKALNSFYLSCLKKLKSSTDTKMPKLMDIGTANGHFLDLAAQLGLQAEGIEISQKMISQGQANGRKISYGQSGKLDPKFLNDNGRKYDIISLWDVIEHLPDLEKSFSEINTLLKPGGLLVIGTPDAGSLWAKFFGKKWHSFVPPEHIVFFNKNNIKNFLGKNNYTVITAKTMHKVFSLPYIFNMAYRWQKLKIYSKLAHYTQKKPLLAKLKFKIPIGDNMLIIARKI